MLLQYLMFGQLGTLSIFYQGKLLVIGTTSEVSFLDSVGFCDTFSVTYHVPTLNKDDAEKVNCSFLSSDAIDHSYIYIYVTHSIGS